MSDTQLKMLDIVRADMMRAHGADRQSKKRTYKRLR
jgi:hypothetical protein